MSVATDPRLAAYALLTRSWQRSLIAANKSQFTITNYLVALEQFGAFLVAQGMPAAPEHIAREHVEAWLGALRERGAAANTLAARYKALRVWFAWLAEEHEIPTSPMARMKPPAVPEQPPLLLSTDQLRRVLKQCEGRDFYARRDLAILRLLLDTGMRRGELAGILVADIDWDLDVVIVTGKGRRDRACPFGKKTAVALDRYVRERARHRFASLPQLWLGLSGPLTGNGVYQVVRNRAVAAGLGHAWPHLLRHIWAHNWLAAGGQETDLLMLAGWRSRSMLSRYGASAAAARAREAHRRLSLGDQV